MNIVLIDIDHTLADAAWRDSLVGGEGGWDEYHHHAKADAPVQGMVKLVNALHNQGYEIFALTTRPEKWRKATSDWLFKHNVKIDLLLMRPDDCFLPSPESKLKLVKEHFRATNIRDEIAFIIDDRDDVLEAFRAEGIITLHCHA